MNEPRATVYKVGDTYVIDDPDARGVMRAVARENCRRLVREHLLGRVKYFVDRISSVHGKTGADYLVVQINVDDELGGQMAAELMPGHDWQAYRDRGEVPHARGLVERPSMQAALAEVDPIAAEQLAAIAGVAVLVVDFGTIEAFTAEELIGG
jgi:hypothetical protein